MPTARTLVAQTGTLTKNQLSVDDPFVPESGDAPSLFLAAFLAESPGYAMLGACMICLPIAIAGAIAAVYPARDAKETATLLAAAPGMLAALKDSALEFLRCAEDCAGTPNYQHFRELARIANVVVAKAEGRSESVPMSNIAVADEPVDGGPIPDAKLEDTLL